MTWRSETPNRLRGRAADEQRARIHARDGRICGICRLPGADEIDHIVNLAAGGSTDDDNCRSVHRLCHQRKTLAEANAARGPRPRQARPREQHPGLIPAPPRRGTSLAAKEDRGDLVSRLPSDARNRGSQGRGGRR